MTFWLVGKTRVQLKRLSHLSKDVNPLYTAVLLFIHFILAFFVAVLAPVLIRKAALPPSIRNEIELNLLFETCTAELHGICSFPSAVVEYEKGSLFSPSVTYALSIRLRFADIGQEQKLGIFQNSISLYDKDDLLRTYSKSSYLVKPCLLTRLLRTIFFPLYYAGLFFDYNTLDIPVVSSHSESVTKSSTKLLYQLQDRFAQVESAVLIVDARFGIIRHFLYNWPLTSSAVLFVSSFSACCFLILMYWGTRSLAFLLGSSGEKSICQSISSGSLDTKSETTNSSSGSTIPLSVNAEEYLPDNIDEVPCFSDFTGIPSWEMQPVLENLSDIDPTVTDDIR